MNKKIFFSFFIVVLTITLFSFGIISKEKEFITHKVKEGETLIQIAKDYDTSVKDLIRDNNIENENFIKIGEEIKIYEDEEINALNVLLNMEEEGQEDFTAQKNDLKELKFRWPVVNKITSKYGARWNEIHTGIDIGGMKVGTPIRASEDGVVTYSGEKGNYGLLVILKHEQDFKTYYAHTSKIFVNKGDTVKKGQVIALVGETGRATGPHLHFEIRKNGKHINPLNFLKKIS